MARHQEAEDHINRSSGASVSSAAAAAAHTSTVIPNAAPSTYMLECHSQLGDSPGRGARHPTPGAGGLVPHPVSKASSVVPRRLLPGHKCLPLYYCRIEAANEVVNSTKGQHIRESRNSSKSTVRYSGDIRAEEPWKIPGPR